MDNFVWPCLLGLWSAATRPRRCSIKGFIIQTGHYWRKYTSNICTAGTVLSSYLFLLVGACWTLHDEMVAQVVRDYNKTIDGLKYKSLSLSWSGSFYSAGAPMTNMFGVWFLPSPLFIAKSFLHKAGECVIFLCFKSNWLSCEGTFDITIKLLRSLYVIVYAFQLKFEWSVTKVSNFESISDDSSCSDRLYELVGMNFEVFALLSGCTARKVNIYSIFAASSCWILPAATSSWCPINCQQC